MGLVAGLLNAEEVIITDQGYDIYIYEEPENLLKSFRPQAIDEYYGKKY